MIDPILRKLIDSPWGNQCSIRETHPTFVLNDQDRRLFYVELSDGMPMDRVKFFSHEFLKFAKQVYREVQKSGKKMCSQSPTLKDIMIKNHSFRLEYVLITYKDQPE